MGRTAPPTATSASEKSPSPGRREGDGRGDRGEVSGGGPLTLLAQPLRQLRWRILQELLQVPPGAGGQQMVVGLIALIAVGEERLLPGDVRLQRGDGVHAEALGV